MNSEVIIFMIFFLICMIVMTIPTIMFFVSIFKIIKTSKEEHETVKNHNEAKLCQRIWLNDANFSAEDIKQKASKYFLIIQDAIVKRDSKILRGFETDSLYLQHKNKINKNKRNEEIHIIEDIYITNSEIVSYIVDGQYEMIGIKLDSNMKDYIIDEYSNEIKKGTKNEVYKSFYMEFMRKKGVLTNSNKEISVTQCPNCGAPLTVTDNGQCEYCQTVITNGSFSWVLNGLEDYDEKKHRIQVF